MASVSFCDVYLLASEVSCLRLKKVVSPVHSLHSVAYRSPSSSHQCAAKCCACHPSLMRRISIILSYQMRFHTSPHIDSHFYLTRPYTTTPQFSANTSTPTPATHTHSLSAPYTQDQLPPRAPALLSILLNPAHPHIHIQPPPSAPTPIPNTANNATRVPHTSDSSTVLPVSDSLTGPPGVCVLIR